MTPGQLQTLLNQTIIPATMILSFFFIGTKFENYQLGGALLIIAGEGRGEGVSGREGGGRGGE